MLMRFWRGKSTPAIRAMFNLSGYNRYFKIACHRSAEKRCATRELIPGAVYVSC
jgi:hypothetical protein